MMLKTHRQAIAIADHLVLQLPEGMKARLEGLALSRASSVEAEAIRAIEAYLLEQSRMNILALAMEAKLVLADANTPISVGDSREDIDYLDGLAINSAR